MIIELRNSHCKYILEPTESYLDGIIKKYLTYKVDGYQFTPAYKKGGWDGTKCFVSRSKFATGFLPAILKLVESKGVQVELQDKRNNTLVVKDDFVTEVGNKEGWTLRDYQQEVVKVTLTNTIQGHPFIRGQWYCEPNSGKTSLMVGLIKNLVNPKVLVIIDRRKNFTQTYEFLSECLDVGRIGEGKLELDHQVTIAMVSTLKSAMSKNEDVLHLVQSANLIICDEAHRAASDTYKAIFKQTDCYSVILMSGTLLDIKDTGKKLQLFSCSGSILARITDKDLAKYNVSLAPKVEVYLNDTDSWATGTYSYDYSNLVVESKPRVNTIIDIFKEDPTQIILIAVRYIEHAEFIHHHLVENLPNYRIEYAHGQDKDKDAKIQEFTDRKINILISTSILQESINIPCITTVVFAQAGKSAVSIKQWKGRGARIDKESNVQHLRFIDFWDVGLEKQSRARITIYKKEGYDVTIKYPHDRFYKPKRTY